MNLKMNNTLLNKLFEDRKNMNREQVVSAFDEWAKEGKYEKDMERICNKGVDIVTQAAADYFTSDKDKITVIDIAAGTGLAAEALIKLGFKTIDGIDPSNGMKQCAMAKNIYRNYYVDYVDGYKTEIQTDNYDCAVISGGLSQSLMPCNSLFEITRIVKPGGVICIEMIESNLVKVEEFKNRLEPLWNQFLKEGVWKLIRRDKIDELVTGETGLLMVYQVQVSETTLSHLPCLITRD